MEDRIVRDSQKTQRLANGLKKRTQDYNQILVEVWQREIEVFVKEISCFLVQSMNDCKRKNKIFFGRCSISKDSRVH